MVGAHQNLNGSSDLTTLLSGMICHPRLELSTINLHTKFEVFIPTHYKNEKGYKMWKMEWFGQLGVIQGHWK